jgi:hypothetical protein
MVWGYPPFNFFLEGEILSTVRPVPLGFLSIQVFSEASPGCCLSHSVRRGGLHSFWYLAS